MPDELNKQKQEADEDPEPKKVNQDNFTAEELGEASSYDGTQEMMLQMQNQNPATDAPALDDRHKRPQHHSAESALSKKQAGNKE